MDVPREALQLCGNLLNPRLVTVQSHKDYTDLMLTWSCRRLEELEREGLDGYIFKSRSPSCGLRHLKVYYGGKVASKNGVGLWAHQVKDYFPDIPAESEDRLHDPLIRDNFIEQVFVWRHWRELLTEEKTLGNLKRFHTIHSLVIMSHSVAVHHKLARLLAEKNIHITELYSGYYSLLRNSLGRKATIKKNTAVLLYAMRRIEKYLSYAEKQELFETIDAFARGKIPHIVPLTLINHYVRIHEINFLRDQYYLNPHPIELRLRFHA